MNHVDHKRRFGKISEAAAEVTCSPRTIRRYIAAGRLHAYRVGPRMIRVDLDEVATLMKPIPTSSNVA